MNLKKIKKEKRKMNAEIFPYFNLTESGNEIQKVLFSHWNGCSLSGWIKEIMSSLTYCHYCLLQEWFPWASPEKCVHQLLHECAESLSVEQDNSCQPQPDQEQGNPFPLLYLNNAKVLSYWTLGYQKIGQIKTAALGPSLEELKGGGKKWNKQKQF